MGTCSEQRYASHAPKALAVLRIVAAFMLIQTGTMKLFAFPMGMPPDNGTAAAFTQIWFAGVLETFVWILFVSTVVLFGLDRWGERVGGAARGEAAARRYVPIEVRHC